MRKWHAQNNARFFAVLSLRAPSRLVFACSGRAVCGSWVGFLCLDLKVGFYLIDLDGIFLFYFAGIYGHVDGHRIFFKFISDISEKIEPVFLPFVCINKPRIVIAMPIIEKGEKAIGCAA